MLRKRQAVSCFSEAEPNVGQRKMPTSRQTISETIYRKARQILKDQHAVASVEEQERLIDQLSESARRRKAVAHLWSKNRKADDIIGLIRVALDSADLDEAVWRSFLAAHFGRASTDPPQIHSASRLLCGFGSEPVWTWQRISSKPLAFRKWLADHASDLQTLSYGNHRKYESKQPGDIWEVVNSFIDLASKFGSPKGLVTIDLPEPTVAGARFDQLYRRFSALWKFGRTGAFDFLVLLIDLGFVSAEPASCYLRGATGPRRGAEQLWGKRPVGEIEELAAMLAEGLDVSPIAVEDALCNWQK
jgi:Alpha-glutamyl/putrescinyl thymine pyrophosphorylase clade 3